MAATKADTANDLHKFFNFKRISVATGIQPDKIYNKLNKRYDSWTDEDKKKIFTVLKPAVLDVFEKLGIEVTFKKAS